MTDVVVVVVLQRAFEFNTLCHDVVDGNAVDNVVASIMMKIMLLL